MNIFTVALEVAGAVGLPAVILFWIRDRRKNRAEATIAEQTVGASVTKADSGALEAHVLAVERAFQVERNSKDRQIAALELEVHRVEDRCAVRISDLEREVHEKDGLIAGLRAELATVTDRLSSVTADFEALRQRLEGGHL